MKSKTKEVKGCVSYTVEFFSHLNILHYKKIILQNYNAKSGANTRPKMQNVTKIL